MIEVKNGKLLQDGVVIRPEFGNDEHLKAIKKTEQRRDELANGIPIEFVEETKIVVESSFRCACEKMVFLEFEFEDDDWSDEVIGDVNTCRNCGQKWEVIEDEDDDGFKVRMCK